MHPPCNGFGSRMAVSEGSAWQAMLWPRDHPNSSRRWAIQQADIQPKLKTITLNHPEIATHSRAVIPARERERERDIYIYIYTYIHTYIHTYVHTYVHTYIHTYIHMHMCMHMCTHACVYIEGERGGSFIYSFVYSVVFVDICILRLCVSIL